VSVEEDHAAPDGDRAPAAPLVEYVARMRRQRWWYFGAVAGVVVAVLIVVVVVMATSEISHVRLQTAASPAPAVPSARLAESPRLAWQSSDSTAIGQAFDGGTVVTYSTRAATGRNAQTGAVVWSYSRSDRTVCTVAQIEDRTLAVFAKDGNCDEMTTLSTGTGKRLAVRTLVDNGHPAFTALSDTLVLTTPDTVHAIDPISGYDRWFFQQPSGCRTAGVALGVGGALIGQRCADGGHLLLRDRNAAADDKNTQVKWRLAGVDAIPLAAEDVAMAVDPATGDLVAYDLVKGAVLQRTPLSPRPVVAAPISRLATTKAELVQIGSTTYSVDPTGSHVVWTATTRGLPTVTTTQVGSGAPALVGALVLAPSASGVVSLSGTTGQVERTYPVPAPAEGSQVFPVGTGFLVAGPTTTVYR
jgi:outer membrane protein assembly factor BamB